MLRLAFCACQGLSVFLGDFLIETSPIRASCHAIQATGSGCNKCSHCGSATGPVPPASSKAFAQAPHRMDSPKILDHVNALRNVPSFGKRKQKKLCAAFPTPEALNAASEVDFMAVEGISGKLARMLYTAKADPDASFWSGYKRTVMWNKITRKKVAGGAAPIEENAEAWLNARRGTHERYNGQDSTAKDPTTVPIICRMSERDLDQHCREDSCCTVAGAQARLPEAVEPSRVHPVVCDGDRAEVQDRPRASASSRANPWLW